MIENLYYNINYFYQLFDKERNYLHWKEKTKKEMLNGVSIYFCNTYTYGHSLRQRAYQYINIYEYMYI